MKLATMPVTRDTLLADVAQAIKVLHQYGNYEDRRNRAARVAMDLANSRYFSAIVPREPTYSGDWSTDEIAAIHVYFNSDTDQFDIGRWETCFRYLLWDGSISYAYLGAEKRNRSYIDVALRLRDAHTELKLGDLADRNRRLAYALRDATGKHEWEISDLITA